MINLKITSLLDGNLSLDMAQGKSVLLKPGEILKAEVVNVLQSGDLVLKIQGELITAKTEVPLQLGDTAFFKVSDSPTSPNQLKLQFVGFEDTSHGVSLPENFMSTTQGQTLAGLIQELSDSLSAQNLKSSLAENQSSTQPLAQQEGTPNAPQKVSDFQGTPAASGKTDTFPLDKVESLLKALPSDINVLPDGIKTQLQDLLLSSLKSTGQSIQSRLDTALDQLSDTLKNSPVAENFKADIMVSMERLLSSPLKDAILNTGVALEAKLKSAASAMQLNPVDMQEETEVSAGIPVRDAILNTEVAPEAKLKPEVFTMQFNPVDVKEETGVSAGIPDLRQSAEVVNVSDKANTSGGANDSGKAGENLMPSQADVTTNKSEDKSVVSSPFPALQNDLKAVLLELKQRLAVSAEIRQAPQDAKAPVGAKEMVRDSAALKGLQGTIEGLLKDVETFQALSKTTDSFYTFLPVNWKELKDGELSFKRGRAGTTGGDSCSCRINLDLADAGNLSILVLMHNKDFFISFKADSPETHSTIDTGLEELRTSFAQKGLSLKAAHILDKTDTSMEKLDKLGSSDRIVSIKA